MNWFLLASLSAVFSAVSTIFEKRSLFKMKALDFSFLVSIFGFLFSIPFFFQIDFGNLNPTSLAILFIKSILGAMAFLSVMMSLKNMEISRALPLLALSPGVVALFAFILLGESLSLQEIIGMGLLLVGTYILETKPVQTFFEPFHIFFRSKDYRYIILALLLFTATSIMDKLLLKQYKLPPIDFMAFQQLFFAIIFSVIFLFGLREHSSEFKSIDKKLLLFVIAVALLTVGYRYTQIHAVKLAPVSLVLAVKRTSVFFAAIIGGKLFNEGNLVKKAIAAAIIIGGSMLILQE
jgi:transporter family protein